jgi:hypothetical protein
VISPVCAAYVVHFDESQKFGGTVIKELWNAISERMHAMLPSASAHTVKELRATGARERLYTADAHHFVSDDMVSQAIESPLPSHTRPAFVSRSVAARQQRGSLIGVPVAAAFRRW